jgi:hypothetical protein
MAVGLIRNNMRKKTFGVIIMLICFVYGCKSKHEKLKIKLTNVITSYMEQTIDGFKVDSVSIMGIDSLTDLDFAYFKKVILKNQELQLYNNPLLYENSVSDEEFDEQQKLQLQLQNIQHSIFQCDSILIDERTDTITVQYFFVGTIVYGKDKQKKIQVQEIGFPVNKHFEVEEINIFN